MQLAYHGYGHLLSSGSPALRYREPGLRKNHVRRDSPLNIPAAFGTMLSMPLPEKVDPLPRQRDRTSRVFLRQSKRGSNQPLTFLLGDLAGGSIASLSPKIAATGGRTVWRHASSAQTAPIVRVPRRMARGDLRAIGETRSWRVGIDDRASCAPVSICRDVVF